jgi:hypothetical protein
MPLYKTGIDMFRKYQAKYNPTVVSTRFTDVQSIALERAQVGLSNIATIRDLVRPILDSEGVGGGMRGTYLAFATALQRHVIRQKGVTAQNTAQGLKSYFVTAYGLDPDICNSIIALVTGWTPPY